MKIFHKPGVRPVAISIEQEGACLRVMRRSEVTGKDNTMVLPITEQQVLDWLFGRLIQDVMPDLTAGQREFLISGCTPEEWAKIVGEEI